MDTTISCIPVFPEEFTLAQLPFFSEDCVYDTLSMPYTPSSVCKACWKGPFAKNLGLSPQDRQWYPPWPEKNSYSTSRRKLRSRADAGCVWCRFVLRKVREAYRRFGKRLIVSLLSDAREWFNHSGWPSWRHSHRPLVVDINGVYGFYKFNFFSTDPDDPAAPYISTRNRILDVGSARAMDLARQRIDECVYGHECCKSPNGIPQPRLPTRLVDCTDLSHPRLVSSNKEHAEYLSLSYVWGEDQIHKTTRSNLSMYGQGISPSLLPATIRDAIRVTHLLGFRWLWVDSLCILQDSDEDKLHEVGRMHHIYRYAHLTIIAGSANKASEGFLHQRSPSEDEITLPFICPPNPSASTACQDIHPQIGTVRFGPASLACNSYSDDLGLMRKRAWCMQEYLVSPRSLIFTPATLHFRCLAGMRGIGEGSLCPVYNKPRIPRTLFLQDPPVAEPGSREWMDVHEVWLEVVKDYSGRTASVESDKLVACAAVAEQFHRVLRSDYLAGLWRSDALLIDLLWMTAGHQHPSPGRPSHIWPTAYRAPSWSWAAIEGDISQSFETTSYYDGGGVALARILECRVTLRDSEIPFGQVTSGTLVLSGTLIPYHGANLTRTFPVFPEPNYCYPWQAPLPSFEKTLRLQQRGYGALNDDEDEDDWIEGAGLNFCIDCDSDTDAIGKLWVVPVVRFQFGRCDEQWVHGLVLTMAPPSSSSGTEPERTRFRRVGVFEADATAEEGLGYKLWDPLTKAMQDGKWPLTDIEIV